MEGNELAHYGIKGMKWGVRRTEAQLARARGNTTSKKSESAVKKKSSTSISNKKISEMSDEELNRIVNRLQLEKRYRDLNPEKVSAGKKFVNTVMNQVVVPAATEAGKQILKEYITSAAKSAATKATKK